MSADVVTLMRALDFVARKHSDQRRKGAAAEPKVTVSAGGYTVRLAPEATVLVVKREVAMGIGLGASR